MFDRCSVLRYNVRRTDERYSNWRRWLMIEIIEDMSEDGKSRKVKKVEKVDLQVPPLCIVKIPEIALEDVKITFDEDVKVSEPSERSDDKEGAQDANEKIGFGPFHIKTSLKGTIASHERNTKSTDNSAKYQVRVHAKDSSMPEGLKRMLDELGAACSPVENKIDVGDTPLENTGGTGDENLKHNK